MSNNEKNISLSKCWIDFSTIPYERCLEERALYPFSELNYLTGGMELGEISIIAGETGAGKTTFVTQIVDEMIKDDKVGCIYGEGTIRKQQLNTYRQMTPYARDNYTYLQYHKNGRKTNIGGYFVDEKSEKFIKEKTVKKLFYYNTSYGMTIPKILEVMGLAHSKGGINYFIIDNMTQVETATENEVKELKDGVEALRRFAIDNLVHIVLIAHYRKMQDMQLIRRNLQEIMGTSATGQKASTVLNIMRLDNIDRSINAYKHFKKICELNNYDLEIADSVIEVLKTRHNKLGFVCLKYNKITNTYYECKKIDPTKEEANKPIIHIPKQSRMDDLVPIRDFDELPF